MLDRQNIISAIVEEIILIKKKIAHENRSFFLGLDMTHTQWLIIKLIIEKKQANIKDISEYLEVTSSAATQQIEALVKNGYIERKTDVADRRIVNLFVTNKTVQQVAQIRCELKEQFISIFDALSNDELNLYLALNKKIIHKITSIPEKN